MIRCDSLDRPVNENAFAEHFDDTAVVSFPNLGRNAILVVPCPVSDPQIYGHLAEFTRNAPLNQQHVFWKTIAETMASRVDTQPVWLSTAGMGVSWLHVRLDDRPKYYAHDEYRKSF